MGYFDVDYVSNSSLGEFKRFLNGEPAFQCKQETLDKGSLFHKAALEKDRYEIGTDPNIDNMVSSLEKNMLYNYMRFHKEAKLEHEKYYTCPHTGVKIKIKMDIWVLTAVGDPKGTACTTSDAFRASITAYGYNRQAAMYLDGSRANAFTFWGVGKKYPHPVFTHSFGPNDREIEAGREEYIYLINKGISMGLIKPKTK